MSASWSQPVQKQPKLPKSNSSLNQRGLPIMPGLSSDTMNAHRNIRGSKYSWIAPLPPFPALLYYAPAQRADLSKMHHPDSWVFVLRGSGQWATTSKRLEDRRNEISGDFSPIPSLLSHGSGSSGAPLGPQLWQSGPNSSASAGTGL